jgi:hypothetical protein
MHNVLNMIALLFSQQLILMLSSLQGPNFCAICASLPAKHAAHRTSLP